VRPLCSAAGRGLAAALLALGARVAGAEEKGVDLAEVFRRARPAPALRAAADRAGFPMAGVAVGAPDAVPAPGDRAVALVSYGSLAEPVIPTQWFLRFTMAAPGGAPTSGGRDLILYSTQGDSFAFHSGTKAAIDVDLLGPAGGPTALRAPAPTRRRVQASPDFLMLDVSRATAAIHRIRAQIKDRPPSERGNFGIASAPFPAAEVERDRRQLEPYHLTVDDRRSFAGMLPAFAEFLGIVQGTPGLQDILWQVLERPSVFDFIRHVGNANPNFTIDYAEPVDSGDLFWSDPGRRQPAQLLVVTLALFGKPVLRVGLLAVAPRPPLEVTAGVLAAAAWGPAHPDRVVVVRVVSAGTGP